MNPVCKTTGSRGFWNDTGRTGIGAWIFSTDHKRIGLLYFYSVLAFFLVGVVLGLLLRIELMAPGRTIMAPQTYNALFTVHGVAMIFLFIIPVIPASFGNMLMPIQIGARDVAFPRLNLLSWWLYTIGAGTVLISLFTGGGPERAEEQQRMVSHLTNNETYFFREQPQLEVFANHVLRSVKERKSKSGERTMSVASIGCSTGARTGPTGPSGSRTST